MKSLLCEKKMLTIALLLLIINSLTACSPIRTVSLVKIENEEEQFKKIEEELHDLKEIKIKCFAPEQFAEIQEKIYENYFRNKDDKEHQEEKVFDGIHDITYKTEDMYQGMTWKDDRVHYYGELFGEDYAYEDTEEQVIREEVEKFFKVLGLEYNNEENGYVIERMVVQGDNSTEVYIRRNIVGKELSLAGAMTVEASKAEDIVITFGNNQIIDIVLRCLSEVVEIKDYQEEVFVDTPQKACKLLDNFFRSWGFGKMTVDTVKIAYATSREEDGIYTLRPMMEFYIKPAIKEETGKVYRVDLTTKEVSNTLYCSYLLSE